MLRLSRLYASRGGLFAATPVALGSKGGTPKRKRNMMMIRRRTYGIQFKEKFMKLTEWYYCPLCAEPKKEGEWCRREDCRQIKP
jgi:hypothetical protein